MHGLDSNVLLRFVLADHPGQHELARRFLGQECTRDNPGYVSVIVLCEMVWVLAAQEKRSRDDIHAVLEWLTQSPEIKVEHAATVIQVLPIYRDTRSDFADLVIAALNKAAGCEDTVTFDRVAARQGRFTLLR